MRKMFGVGAMLAMLVPAAVAQATCPSGQTCGWQLVWSDEFNGTAGTLPDPSKWNFDLGGGGWGNGEVGDLHQFHRQRLPGRQWQSGDPRHQRRSGQLHLGAPADRSAPAPRPTRPTQLAIRPHRGAHQASLRQGRLAGVLDAGRGHSTTQLARFGEVDIMENFGTYQEQLHRQQRNGARPGLFRRQRHGSPVYVAIRRNRLRRLPRVRRSSGRRTPSSGTSTAPAYHTVTPASLPAGTKWVFQRASSSCSESRHRRSDLRFLGTPDASRDPFRRTCWWTTCASISPSTVSATTPSSRPGRIVNAASYLGAISPGSLATVYGNNLADAVHMAPTPGSAGPSPRRVARRHGDRQRRARPAGLRLSGVRSTFRCRGKLRPPWRPAVPVKVTWNGRGQQRRSRSRVAGDSSIVFLSEFVNGVAWVTGSLCRWMSDADHGVLGEGGLHLSALGEWAGGEGHSAVGWRAGRGRLQVPGGPPSCTMTVGSKPATVVYCGAAPVEIIDQVNFTYPEGVTPTGTGYVGATLTVAGSTIHFRVPEPAR